MFPNNRSRGIAPANQVLLAYFLTLKDSSASAVRDKVQTILAEGVNVEVIPGINGSALSASEYYKFIITGLKENGILLSPTELGCTLSHIAIIDRFLKSNAQYALIFEDDVIIADHSFDRLRTSLDSMKPNDVLVAGCQQGLRLGPFFGSAMDNRGICYLIDKQYWTRVKRTCAYIVGRRAAIYIRDVQNRGFYNADDYRVLCPPFGRLLFCDAFAHPIPLHSSLIEAERSLKLYKPPRSLFSRVFDEVSLTLSRRRSRILHSMRRFRGLKEVPCSQ